jgi:hypothetical protein
MTCCKCWTAPCGVPGSVLDHARRGALKCWARTCKYSTVPCGVLGGVLDHVRRDALKCWARTFWTPASAERSDVQVLVRVRRGGAYEPSNASCASAGRQVCKAEVGVFKCGAGRCASAGPRKAGSAKIFPIWATQNGWS